MDGTQNPKDVRDILLRYQNKLGQQVNFGDYGPSSSSSDYETFREEALTRNFSFYEFMCNSFGGLATIKPNEKEQEKLEESIKTSHLQITPEQAGGFGVFVAFLLILVGISLFLAKYFLTENWSIGANTTDFLIPLSFAFIGVLLIKPLTSIPNRIAAQWRLKASNQMVLCILYVVIYMKHTPNLENALRFASEHIGNPLALDLKKVFWNVEAGKFSTIKESLEDYLSQWRNYNLEFVESFHLIQGSLFEADEDRRVTMLEKSLEVMIEGTYEKMLHYAQEMKSPITMLHMLGIILPILGLVILPLVGSLMEGSGESKVIFFAVLYNILLPVAVYLFGTNLLSKRPTGYSETNLMQEKRYERNKNIILKLGNSEILISPFLPAAFIFLVVSSIGIAPLVMHLIGYDFPLGLGTDNFLDYKLESGLSCTSGKTCYGPFGLGALLLSLFLPLGLILSMGVYHRLRTRDLIKIRDRTKKLELEFSGSLFQLGSRVGDGIPIELAFGEVAENLKGTPTGDFFSRISSNIRALGIGVKEAIFGKAGAIWGYPSSLIQSSMKVLLESSKKGPEVVSRSLISISTYVKDIHRVNERLKDLLSDILSSMRSQISFLTPAIAGIVVGISSMIVTILVRLTESIAVEASTSETFLGTSAESITALFQLPSIIPTYYLQLIVGIYVVEIIFLLTKLSNSIEYGSDDLNEKYTLSKNLYTGGLLYFFAAFFVSIIFSLLSMQIAP